jgi:hypothetical protein
VEDFTSPPTRACRTRSNACAKEFPRCPLPNWGC